MLQQKIYMYVRTLFFLLFFFSTLSLFSDWNEQLDQQTSQLLQELPALNTTSYRSLYSFFQSSREKILHDHQLLHTFTATTPAKKFHFASPKYSLMLKKRRNNHIHDVYAWEVSYLLKASQYLSPSFPVEIATHRIVIQPIEKFEVGKGKSEAHSPATLQKVTLETYWKAHLTAYLLGLADMAGRNIGVTLDGTIRFFDTEISFCYFNTPIRTETSFTSGFILQSFDWPHYRQPLDPSTTKKIRAFIQALDHVEKDLAIYRKYRPLAIPEEGFLTRLNLVRTFPLKEGLSFRDFFGFTSPKMSSGLDQLYRIVNGIVKRKGDHGSTLFYTCRWMKNQSLTPEQHAAIHHWIDEYIQPE